jgi:hypothetical protein
LDGDAHGRIGPFRPEVFFVGRTEGWGLTRGPTGRLQRRCQVITEGRLDDAYRAIKFDEAFHWEDGERDEWRWAMTRGLNGQYVAAEALAGPGIQGRYEGADYVLSFRRPLRIRRRAQATLPDPLHPDLADGRAETRPRLPLGPAGRTDDRLPPPRGLTLPL